MDCVASPPSGSVSDSTQETTVELGPKVSPQQDSFPTNDGHICSKRICVIGAGPAGLAVLKALSQTSYFQAGSWEVIAYESRSNVGGIWSPAPPIDDPPLTPLYDSLTTNLPHPVMGYTEYLFPPSTPLFPEAATVQTYLESYASHFNILPLIRFNTSVTNAAWKDSRWKVMTSTEESLDFDNLVVANGHYRKPNVPDTPGLDHWLKTHKVSHSALYRNPHGFGSKVLVVGAGPSGRDIATELHAHGRLVIHSIAGPVAQDDQPLKMRGKPLHFYDNGRVLFEGGIIEENIDHCILATGFHFDYPFFDDATIRIAEVPSDPTLPSNLYNSRYHVFPLAKYLFPLQSHYPASSVAFMTLLYRVAPLPIAEAQAQAIIRVFADPQTALDMKKEVDQALSRSRALVEAGASSPIQLAKNWFRLTQAEQWAYRDELYAYAAEVGHCPATKVTHWEKEMYHNKDILRKAWVALEKKGESQRWVKGVGGNGVQEWVELMYKLLQEAKRLEYFEQQQMQLE